MIATTGQDIESYVSQVVNLHTFMLAHWHVILHHMPRSYRNLTRALRRALAALSCRIDGSYPNGC